MSKYMQHSTIMISTNRVCRSNRRKKYFHRKVQTMMNHCLLSPHFIYLIICTCDLIPPIPKAVFMPMPANSA